MDRALRTEVSSVRRLNLGAGFDRGVPCAVNLDLSPVTRPDVVADLNGPGLPFRDSVFDEVYCKDVLEHLDDLRRPMEEIYRVSKPGARVIITAPHFSCANTFIDITHKRALSAFSFDYFDESSRYSYYTCAKFKVRHRYIFFHRTRWLVPFQVLANRYPHVYEHHFAYIVPAWFVYFELEVRK